MRAANWGVALVIGLLVLAGESCGGESSSDNSGKGGKASGGTGGSKATGGTSSGGTTAGGGTSSGGASGSGGSGGLPLGGSGGSGGQDGGALDGAVVTDAGYFVCGGCVCDGATHYCLVISGGALIPPQPDAAICPDQDASFSNGCLPLPNKCGGVPACDCIDVPYPGGTCQCSDVGGGLQVFCALP